MNGKIDVKTEKGFIVINEKPVDFFAAESDALAAAEQRARNDMPLGPYSTYVVQGVRVTATYA